MNFIKNNIINFVILLALVGAGFSLLSKMGQLDMQIQTTQTKLGENKTITDDNNKRIQDLEKQAEDIQKDVDDLNADIDTFKGQFNRTP